MSDSTAAVVTGVTGQDGAWRVQTLPGSFWVLSECVVVDYEQKLQSFYESFLAPGMVAADVGAHAGRHAFEMARLVGPQGRVHMFEPLPQMQHHLRQSVAADPLLRTVTILYPYALANVSGVTEFCVATDALAYSGIRERHYDSPTGVQRIRVEVRRLDDVLASVPALDYIKIDTEGAEWDVLQGAAALIARFHPVVTFEFGENSYAPYGVDPARVHAFFVAHGYLIFDILGRELGEAVFVESSRRQEVWDYVAVPAARRSLADILRA
jgi:FkbM family methyltransferase